MSQLAPLASADILTSIECVSGVTVPDAFSMMRCGAPCVPAFIQLFLYSTYLPSRMTRRLPVKVPTELRRLLWVC